MAKPRRLTDDELAQHAAASQQLRAKAREAEAEAKLLQELVIVEMQARKKLVEEVGGLRITVKTSKRQLSLDRARTTLRRGVLAAVIRSSIDRKLWDTQKAAGKITDVDESHCTVEVDVAPHIYVNEIKAA